MMLSITKTKIAIHKKTGNEYDVVNDNVIDCTNAHGDMRMVLYTRDSMLFVREKKEFEEKFVYVN